MRISRSIKPRVCITMGYPAGIGPEVILKALASPDIRRLAFFLIIGNEDIFRQSCRSIKKNILYKKIENESQVDFSKKNILFFNVPAKHEIKFTQGMMSSCLGGESIKYIEKAVKLIKSKKADILITAPINKHAAELSGFRHKGHTEFLAKLTNTKKYAMMLKAGNLKVLLATTHLAIKAVAEHLTARGIEDKLVLANLYLRSYLNIKNPIIAVCGLNPHAGDNGLIGNEERKIIVPAIKHARKKGVDARGPLAADAVFFSLTKGVYDAVLCMYHDQGLVALKMIGRNKSVNITLGLPFIRTSPGHGTALDIAGKGTANPESMKQAIKTAICMYLSVHG
jgi:4-hydroxythreonine-4-phosphate dehydrogenase